MATATATRIAQSTRNDFAGRSSGNGDDSYFKTKGHALTAFGEVLDGCGLHLDFDSCVDYNGNEGRAKHTICNDENRIVGCAVFSWYRMPSGRYEFVGYIA